MEELKTANCTIFVKCMPPNVTPLIEPLYQKVLRLTKLYYRGRLSFIISKAQDTADPPKEINLKDKVIHLHTAWQQLEVSAIEKSFHNIFEKNISEEEGDIPLAGLREVWNCETSESLMKNSIHLLQAASE